MSGQPESGRTSERAARSEGLEAAHVGEQNLLLRLLPREDFAALLPQLRSVRLHLRQELVEPEAPILDVYFIREGVASIVASGGVEGDIEAATVGNEGMVGLPLVLGAESMRARAEVQIEGAAWRLPADVFSRMLLERPTMRAVLLKYVAYYVEFLQQSVACNRLHSLDERCARWLLLTHDRVHGDRFELTQDFLALMIGVRRAGVSAAMGALQADGVISYTRGRIMILDRPRLEEASCGCYAATRDVMRQLLG